MIYWDKEPTTSAQHIFFNVIRYKLKLPKHTQIFKLYWYIGYEIAYLIYAILSSHFESRVLKAGKSLAIWSLYQDKNMVNAYSTGIASTDQKISYFLKFVDILMSISQINEPLYQRHVCNDLNAFFVLIPNIVIVVCTRLTCGNQQYSVYSTR